MGTTHATKTKAKTLNQRILRYYRALRNRNAYSAVLVFLVIVACIGLLVNLIINNDAYTQEQQVYQQQITELQQTREDILSGKTAVDTKSFDDILQEKLADMSDYSTTEDNYSVPIEGTDIALTINKNNIFVADNAQILDDATKEKINTLNRQLAASTNGAQLQVVTITELPNGQSIDSYANAVFQQLGIGDASENNGVLYLVALKEREFRLEVGYGLEGVITDATASDIIDADEVVEAFQDEQYSQGVIQVVDQVYDLMNTKTALVDGQLAKVHGQKSSASRQHWLLLISLLAGILIGLILLLNLLMTRKSLKKINGDYLAQREAFEGQPDSEKIKGMKDSQLYSIVLSGILFPLSAGAIRRATARGRLLRDPKAQKVAMGRILIDDTLYSRDGNILTTTYLTSYYATSWFDNDDSGSGSGGDGGSWGSFGGGSSGGGGASGGW